MYITKILHSKLLSLFSEGPTFYFTNLLGKVTREELCLEGGDFNRCFCESKTLRCCCARGGGKARGAAVGIQQCV